LDEELADEFDRAGPVGGWPYWADVNGTIPLTREEVGRLADTRGAVFYTSQDWHVMHCMYTWRKHYRSKWTGVTIERRSNGIDHIRHCEAIVRDRAPLEKIWTKAGIELNADLI
jgi:cation diffusion facilitator CzcD-associated flavoprotein CzcO